MPVVLRCETARGRSYARGLRADARRVLGAAGLVRAELSIVLVDDAAIRALNRDFRGKDRATDVLSFSQLEQAGSPAPAPLAPDGRAEQLLGDVVISIDTALAQARRMRIAPAARIRTLLIHGLLHLLGYDHERSPADARRMFARERELAAALAARGGARGAKRRRTGAGVARAGARTRPSR